MSKSRRWLAILSVASARWPFPPSPAAVSCRTQSFTLADGSVQICSH
jgi:hypothetical protein